MRASRAAALGMRLLTDYEEMSSCWVNTFMTGDLQSG